jgi:hypothetical protein
LYLNTKLNKEEAYVETEQSLDEEMTVQNTALLHDDGTCRGTYIFEQGARIWKRQDDKVTPPLLQYNRKSDILPSNLYYFRKFCILLANKPGDPKRKSFD